ncbi:hypothetical protein BDL97_18G054200 [Sphagnum fallax]|nr:hypothetical protein BDL97_18G054200 [Sphagnum fallax]
MSITFLISLRGLASSPQLFFLLALRNMAGNDNKGQFGRSPDVAMVLFMILLVVVVMTEFTMTVQARDAQSVTILNQLGAGGVLSLHCMSRDNDLGQQYLQPGENFGFSFHTNFWGTTQFWCTFGWNSHKDAFTVWRGPGFWRNHSQDCYQCLWYVRPEGFYRAQQGDPMTFVVPWDYSSF